MNIDAQNYLATLPESDRAGLRGQLKHSVSYYGLNGEHLEHAFESENLLSVLERMERYLVDSNYPWKCAASKAEHRNKAFIVGQTVTEEEDNLESIFFGPGTDASNDNLFGFGLDEFNGVYRLLIERFDTAFPSIFDKKKLAEESEQRAKRTDAASLRREVGHKVSVAQLKERIAHILAYPNLENRPPLELKQWQKTEIVAIIRRNSPNCLRNYHAAYDVAELCYAALLLEDDKVGQKTRQEFRNPNKRNVFGDTRLIQNALWLGSNILSRDNAVKRMVEYIGSRRITFNDSL
jgi:hypothetical protein